MKKILSPILALAMILGMVACGNKAHESAPNAIPAPETAPEATETVEFKLLEDETDASVYLTSSEHYKNFDADLSSNEKGPKH